MSKLQTIATKLFVKLSGARYEKQLNKAVQDIGSQQEKLLLRILKKNQNTQFGTEHNFAGIQSAAEYASKIPVLEYETLRPYLEQQNLTQKNFLLNEKILFYAMTSGTTGKPKFIPVHKRSLRANKFNAQYMLFNMLRLRPRIFNGKIFAIVSPGVEGYMENSNIPYGATSGHIYEQIPFFMKSKYLIPQEVFRIEDYDLKYLLILRLALEQKNISFLSTANPSTLTKLLERLENNWEQLLEDVASGTFSRMAELSPELQKQMRKRFKKSPLRALELKHTRNKAQGKIHFKDLWPKLQAVSVWTGGSCSIFMERLKNQFSEDTLLQDLGYLSSEFRGTVPTEGSAQGGVPTLLHHYFEFVEQNAYHEEKSQFLGLHQLEKGKKYYIFITTDYGLYRYHMNDIVEVKGFRETLPLLSFVQKGKGVTSVTGEKLYENQVISAVKSVEAQTGMSSNFFLMSCEVKNSQYCLYLERQNQMSQEEFEDLEQSIEQALQTVSVEYATKRQSGRLKPMRLVLLQPGTYDAYKHDCLMSGQREGQFKIVALQYDKDLKFPFETFRQTLYSNMEASVAL